MTKVVVVGAGLGGVSVAYELRESLPKEAVVEVIGEGAEFNFVPSNPWVALGSRKRDDVVMPIAELFKKHHIGFSGAGVKSILADKNRLELNSGDTVDYDYLVICTGPKLDWSTVPGSGPEAGGSHSVCTVDHAAATHTQVQQLCENPGPVLVGALPGASCFGPAYEYVLSLEYELRKRRIRDQVPMTFVTPEPYIGHMGLGGVGDSKGFMEHKFREHGIRWICNAKVTAFSDHECHFEELDQHGKLIKNHQLAYHHAMFLPPFKGAAAVAAVPDLCNPKGFVIIDKHQRSPKYPNIFAAGVCVAIAPIEATPVPVGAPKTGLMIESMTSAIVKNINALISNSNEFVEPTLSALCLADMGNTGAAFLAIPQNPPRNRNWTGSGRWVHWAKVAFEKYFMYKVRRGTSEPIYEKLSLRFMGIERLKPPK